ncbi:MAG: hypothetical protein ACFB6S_11140 [Geminicoccaceae bacterium]
MMTVEGGHSPISDQEAWDLIPWYVNRTLDPWQMEAIDEMMARDPALRAEVAAQRRLAEGVSSLAILDSQVERSLADIRKRIDTSGPARNRIQTRSSQLGRLTGWLRAGKILVWPAGLGAVAAAALVLVVQQPDDATRPTATAPFQTLTTEPSVAEPGDIRLKAAPDVGVEALADLFEAHDLEVLEGPSPGGIYTLRPKGREDRASIAAALADRPEIDFVTVIETP